MSLLCIFQDRLSDYCRLIGIFLCAIFFDTNFTWSLDLVLENNLQFTSTRQFLTPVTRSASLFYCNALYAYENHSFRLIPLPTTNFIKRTSVYAIVNESYSHMLSKPFLRRSCTNTIDGQVHRSQCGWRLGLHQLAPGDLGCSSLLRQRSRPLVA